MDRLRDLIAESLLCAVQTYAEDDDCGDITQAFIDHAAQDIADSIRDHPDEVTG